MYMTAWTKTFYRIELEHTTPQNATIPGKTKKTHTQKNKHTLTGQSSKCIVCLIFIFVVVDTPTDPSTYIHIYTYIYLKRLRWRREHQQHINTYTDTTPTKHTIHSLCLLHHNVLEANYIFGTFIQIVFEIIKITNCVSGRARLQRRAALKQSVNNWRNNVCLYSIYVGR